MAGFGQWRVWFLPGGFAMADEDQEPRFGFWLTRFQWVRLWLRLCGDLARNGRAGQELMIWMWLVKRWKSAVLKVRSWDSPWANMVATMLASCICRPPTGVSRQS